jgi:hypothetical protein
MQVECPHCRRCAGYFAPRPSYCGYFGRPYILPPEVLSADNDTAQLDVAGNTVLLVKVTP